MLKKFSKDKNKIKKLKIRCGIPLFINFCYNQRKRNELNNSKLFIENNDLHYHLKFESGDANNNVWIKQSVQYVIKNVANYTVTPSNIIIEGEIEKTKNGLNSKRRLVNQLLLYRIYQNEKELLQYLEENKTHSL